MIKNEKLILQLESEVEEFLLALHKSAKIKDLHAFNQSQCEAWDKMWSVVDQLLLSR